jgi:hypothetical protein
MKPFGHHESKFCRFAFSGAAARGPSDALPPGANRWFFRVAPGYDKNSKLVNV